MDYFTRSTEALVDNAMQDALNVIARNKFSDKAHYYFDYYFDVYCGCYECILKRIEDKNIEDKLIYFA